jgi:hypothetical protein
MRRSSYEPSAKPCSMSSSRSRIGIVKLSRFGGDGVQRARLHAAAVAVRHCAAASDRKIRVERETRCR